MAPVSLRGIFLFTPVQKRQHKSLELSLICLSYTDTRQGCLQSPLFFCTNHGDGEEGRKTSQSAVKLDDVIVIEPEVFHIVIERNSGFEKVSGFKMMLNLKCWLSLCHIWRNHPFRKHGCKWAMHS